MNCFAGSRRTVWLQRQMSLPGIEPGPRPSQGRMLIRHTPRTCCVSIPCRRVERRLAASNAAVQIRHTRKVLVLEQPVQESNLVLRFRKPLCAPKHSRATKYPDLDSNQGPDLRRVRCNPLHHRDSILFKSRRLDSHQHQPAYKAGAFLNRATSASTSARI